MLLCRCKRKFNVDSFASRYPQAVENARQAGGGDEGTKKKKKVVK